MSILRRHWLLYSREEENGHNTLLKRRLSFTASRLAKAAESHPQLRDQSRSELCAVAFGLERTELSREEYFDASKQAGGKRKRG